MEDNNQYQAPNPSYGNDDQPLTVGEWIVTFIICAIPCVGIVMLFVWAFGNGHSNRRNYARATLIMGLIGIVVGILSTILFGSFFAEVLEGIQGTALIRT